MSAQQEFITKIVPGAKKAYKEFRVLPSLTIAQACLESAFGKASIGNNIFGIKANSKWAGKKQLVWTTEYINGVKQKVQAYFRDYDSIEDSILDHALLLTMTRYKPVIAAKDYKEACVQVQKCGYATDPKYADKLIKIIELYKLQQYDNSPAHDLESAIDILVKHGKIKSPEYWEENAVIGGMVKGEYAAKILIEYANDLGA